MEFFLPITKFDPIINSLNILKEEYKSYNILSNKKYNLFVFPDLELFDNIIERVKILNKSFDNNKNIKDMKIKYLQILYEKILDFETQIKNSSFENLIFNKIKEAYNELHNFSGKIYKKLNKIKDPNESENILEEEIEKMLQNHINSTNIYSDSLNISFNGISSIENEFDEDIFTNEKLFKYDPESPNIKEYTNIMNKLKYKSYYANDLVKNETFNKESLELVNNFFDDCKLLYDFKKIQDELIIKQCKITKDKLNYKYNFIIPNLNLNTKKGGEIYFPPYGWFGIGLNIENKYNNREKDIPKAIAYYGFNNMKSRQIKIMLHIILMKNGLVPNLDLQPKCRFNDKRKKNKKVGTGIYLSPQINEIEQNTGIIYFKGKLYKVALMARVITEKIRQPDNIYWVLNPNEIEFIRIIFKEIYDDDDDD